MTLPVYPGTLPYVPRKGTFRPGGTFPKPLVTTFEDGNVRSRARSLTAWTELAFTLELLNADYAAFAGFFTATLGNASARFTMPIWKPSDGTYPAQEVYCPDGEPMIADWFLTRSSVDMKLRVKNWQR